MHVSVCVHVCMCVPLCVWLGLDARKGVGSHGGGVTDGCELPSGFWELKPGSFGGQLVLLLTHLFSPCIKSTNQSIYYLLFILWQFLTMEHWLALTHSGSSSLCLPSTGVKELGTCFPYCFVSIVCRCVSEGRQVPGSV